MLLYKRICLSVFRLCYGVADFNFRITEITFLYSNIAKLIFCLPLPFRGETLQLNPVYTMAQL